MMKQTEYLHSLYLSFSLPLPVCVCVCVSAVRAHFIASSFLKSDFD